MNRSSIAHSTLAAAILCGCSSSPSGDPTPSRSHDSAVDSPDARVDGSGTQALDAPVALGDDAQGARPDGEPGTPDATSYSNDATSTHGSDAATFDAKSPGKEAGQGGGGHDGGSDAGHSCSSNSGCDGGVCINGTCESATCTDGVKDGTESDVDCGGSSCPACGTGKRCAKSSDCASLVCTGANSMASPPVLGTCAAAACTDGVKNGAETDVDCGGGTCPACAAGKKCVANADCASDGCDYTDHCALAPSCTQHHGGDTCGAGEDTDLGTNPKPATDEESCCVSIPIPGTTMIVDKYLITAGRIRAWVTRLNGNIQAITSSIPASNPYWNPEWNQYIPSTMTLVNEQLGPYPAPLTPSPYPPSDTSNDADGEPAGNWLGQWRDGCSMGKPGAPDGARTWWTANPIGSDEAAIVYPQEFLDDKIINCIDSYMLTAFCIWDGGHLATDAELAAAWGAGPFPWSGAAPGVLINQMTQEPQGTDSDGRTAAAYVAHEFGLTPDEFVAPFTYNYDPYGLFADDSYHIPAPGRFPLGAGPYGHMDLAGTTYEATAIKAGTFTAEPPPVPTSVKQVDHIGTLEGGSWEIHPIISGSGTGVTYDPWMPAYWAYWAMAARCGR